MVQSPSGVNMKANENHPGALRGRGSAVPKVLVIERHLAVSDVLSMALKPRYDVHPLLVEPAATPASVVGAALAARPAAAVVTLALGSLFDSESLVCGLTRERIPVVALETADPDADEAALGRALIAGAASVVSKTDSIAVLLQAVACAIVRVPVYSAENARRRVAASRASNERRTARGRLYALTVREREVLVELVCGRTTTEIARDRVVSEATVRTQVRSILGKLEVKSQLAAVAIAVTAGGDFVPSITGTCSRRPARAYDVSGYRPYASSSGRRASP
jgi:two-component system nitrate/nitrite response regulator NarL